MKKRLSGFAISVICIIALALLALILVIGTDTAWGKVKVEEMQLSSADGDRVHAMLYKPKSATAENPAPAIVLYHGGNDMLEHTGTYALELARRGYVVINFDYQGSHDSDYASGTGETTFCGDTIYNTLSSYNFVQQDNIAVFGHSMGGGYASRFAAAYSDHVTLLMHLGSAVTPEPGDFNYISIVGDSDESALKRTTILDEKTGRTNQDITRYFSSEKLSQAWGETDGPIKPDKIYTVKGSDGNDYMRVFYFPHSIHAYYNVNNTAVKRIIYAFIQGMGGFGDIDGVDITDPSTYRKISTVWQWKDIGWVLEYLEI